jgi:hypothetical protein
MSSSSSGRSSSYSNVSAPVNSLYSNNGHAPNRIKGTSSVPDQDEKWKNLMTEVSHLD